MKSLIFPLSQKEAKKAGIVYISEINKNAEFPSKLRKLRENKGISQISFAKGIGITKSTASLYERGDNVPDIKTLAKIAQFYNVSSDYLLGLTKDPTPKPAAANDLGLSPAAINILRENHCQINEHEMFNAPIPLAMLISDIIEDDSTCIALYNYLYCDSYGDAAFVDSSDGKVAGKPGIKTVALRVKMLDNPEGQSYGLGAIPIFADDILRGLREGAINSLANLKKRIVEKYTFKDVTQGNG